MTSKSIHQLDITQEVCPITFVKAKLAIERIAPGDVLEIRLKGDEPLANVPRSLTELGHRLLDLAPAPEPQAEGVHVLRVEKAG